MPGCDWPAPPRSTRPRSSSPCPMRVQRCSRRDRDHRLGAGSLGWHRHGVPPADTARLPLDARQAARARSRRATRAGAHPAGRHSANGSARPYFPIGSLQGQAGGRAPTDRDDPCRHRVEPTVSEHRSPPDHLLACAVVPLFPLAARLRSEPELLSEALAVLEGSGPAARVVAATRAARKAGDPPRADLAPGTRAPAEDRHPTPRPEL